MEPGAQGLRSKTDFLVEMNPNLHRRRQVRDMVELEYDIGRILGGRADLNMPSWIWDRYKRDSIRHCSAPSTGALDRRR